MEEINIAESKNKKLGNTTNASNLSVSSLSSGFHDLIFNTVRLQSAFPAYLKYKII